MFVVLPHQSWMLSISQNGAVKSFDGAIMPIAFVPDWRKSDYVDRRAELTYDEIAQDDLIPLPRYSAMFTDFNSLFTYITVYKGAYMDEERIVGAGSHDGTDIRAPKQTPVFSIAHGIVVKVVNDDNNKYLVVEHKNVKYKNTTGKYYSSYLHLDSVAVNAGDIISKGTIVGKVGMSGITTTPHLHLQIDNDDAPFQPYWPFTFDDANAAGVSFFDGVSNGLNQDLIDLYSVDPIDFIEHAVAVDGQPKTAVQVNDLPREQSIPAKTVVPVKNQIKNTVTSFSDVSSDNKYYNAITYFAKKKVISGYDDGLFRSEKTVTRSELLGMTLNALGIVHHGEILVGIFKDVPKDHWLNPLITEAVKRKIISTDKPLFNPNNNVTKAEFLAIFALAAGEKMPAKVTKTWKDIDSKHWSQPYAEFAFRKKLFSNISGDTFGPNEPVTRGEIAQAMYLYLKNIWKV